MLARNILLALFGCLLGILQGANCAREPEEVIKHDNGLIVTILKKSKDCTQRAQKGDTLKITFIGRSGGPRGPIFEETRPGGSYSFRLGFGEVIFDVSLPIIYDIILST